MDDERDRPGNGSEARHEPTQRAVSPPRREPADGNVHPPFSIGPYRILELLGEGGMGNVYLAEQTEPIRRRVALKILKRGMDTDEVVARFESERQALAVLEHPNIARVIDAGATEAGLPFFVMELVRGAAITDYCDTRKLTTRERTRLFIPVCDAIQHAHLKGLIHRDLKPTNVLVSDADGKATVKIIDFGIAKAVGMGLTDRTLVTRVGEILGTPQYMSPEQAGASGTDVDARTDVYSLGILLYELLAGCPPYDPEGLARAVLAGTLWDVDTPRPSVRFTTLGSHRVEVAQARRSDPERLGRELAGDLDWIVMKAIEKDRTRRYSTPNELGQDLERFLRSEPVVARPPSKGYLAGRFVGRHRGGVAASAAILVALVAGGAAAGAGFVRARAAERGALEEAAVSAEIADLLMDVFASADPTESPGEGPSARQLLLDGVSKLEGRLENRPARKAQLLARMATSLYQIGRPSEAEAVFEEALRMARAGYPEGDPRRAVHLLNLANLKSVQGAYDEAVSLLEEGVRITEAAQEERAVAPRAATLSEADSALRVLPRLLYALGVIAYNRARSEEAAGYFRRARLGHPLPGLREDTIAFAASTDALGAALQSQGALDEAESLYEEALRLRERVYGPENPVTLISLTNLARLALAREENDRADSLFRRVLAIRERDLGSDHPRVADVLGNLGVVARRQGRYDEAEADYRRARSIIEAAFGPDHPDVATWSGNLGRLLLDRDRPDEAVRAFERALTIQRARLGSEHPDLVPSLLGLAAAREELGRPGEAEVAYREALSILGADPDADRDARAEALVSFADFLHKVGRSAEADSLAAIAEALVADSVEHGDRQPEHDDRGPGYGD